MGKNCLTCLHGHLEYGNNHECYCDYKRTHVCAGKDECEHYEAFRRGNTTLLSKSRSVFLKGSPFKWLKNSSPTKLIIILVVVIAILSSSSVLVQRLNAMIGKPTPLSSRATCDITGTDYQILKFEGDQTWEQAQKWCKKQGGHLAIVSSDEENAFLYLIMVGIGEQNAYIGCSKTNNKNEWTWIKDGSFMGLFRKNTYTQLNEPQQKETDCIYAMLLSHQESFDELEDVFEDLEPSYFRWVSGNFKDNKVFICEWEKNK